MGNGPTTLHTINSLDAVGCFPGHAANPGYFLFVSSVKTSFNMRVPTVFNHLLFFRSKRSVLMILVLFFLVLAILSARRRPAEAVMKLK